MEPHLNVALPPSASRVKSRRVPTQWARVGSRLPPFHSARGRQLRDGNTNGRAHPATTGLDAARLPQNAATGVFSSFSPGRRVPTRGREFEGECAIGAIYWQISETGCAMPGRLLASFRGSSPRSLSETASLAMACPAESRFNRDAYRTLGTKARRTPTRRRCCAGTRVATHPRAPIASGHPPLWKGGKKRTGHPEA